MRRAALLAVAGALAAPGCGGGDDRPSREDARRCLEGLDLHVTGSERHPDDRDAPDEELIANDPLKGCVMVFAAYYDEEDRAERYGTLTLLWVRGHDGPLAERTRDCLL